MRSVCVCTANCIYRPQALNAASEHVHYIFPHSLTTPLRTYFLTSIFPLSHHPSLPPSLTSTFSHLHLPSPPPTLTSTLPHLPSYHTSPPPSLTPTPLPHLHPPLPPFLSYLKLPASLQLLRLSPCHLPFSEAVTLSTTSNLHPPSLTSTLPPFF